MAESETWYNSLAITAIGVGLTFFAGLYLHYISGKKIAAKELALSNSKLVDRVVELEKQLSLVSQAVVPISAAFQSMLVRDLTHFHTPEMDNLMARLGPPFSLSTTEVNRLAVLLEARSRDMNDQISDAERDAATMLPLVMKRVLNDQSKSGVEAEPLVRMMIVEKSKISTLNEE